MNKKMKSFSNQVVCLELMGNVSVNAVKGNGGVPPVGIESIPRLERGMTIMVLPDLAQKLLAKKTGGTMPDEIGELVRLYEECTISKSELPNNSRKSQCYDFTGKAIQSENPAHVYIQSFHNKPGSLSLSLLPRIVKVKKHTKSKTIVVRLDDESVWTAHTRDYALLKRAKNKHVTAEPTEWAQWTRTSDYKFAIQNMVGSDSENHEVSVTLKSETTPKHRLYFSRKELSEMKTKQLKTFLNWPSMSTPPQRWENQFKDVNNLLEQRRSESRGLIDRRILWLTIAILIIAALTLMFQVRR